jgi:hypothetical protein
MQALGERLLAHFIGSQSIEPRNLKIVKQGNIRFSIPIQIFCGGDPDILKEIEEVDSLQNSIGMFYSDIIGEMIVRNNLQKFISKFLSIEEKSYRENIAPYNHVHFGIKASEKSIHMQFHLSLLQKIVMDTFFALKSINNVKKD